MQNASSYTDAQRTHDPLKRQTIYDMVTKTITELLEQDIVPWQDPIITRTLNKNRNLISDRPYSGMNALITMAAQLRYGYTASHWMTINQAKTIGAELKENEQKNGTPIIFYNFTTKQKKNEETGEIEDKKMGFARFFTIYNVEQFSNIDKVIEISKNQSSVNNNQNPFEAIDRAQAVIDNMKNRPAIVIQGASAYYMPRRDLINMPKPTSFRSPEAYYATFFHELTHSTGHESRLKRKEVTDPILFGSHNYSKEELTAELGAAFLCAHSNIFDSTKVNNAAYIKTWLRTLKNDPKMLVQAAAKAQKAADYILNRSGNNE